LPVGGLDTVIITSGGKLRCGTALPALRFFFSE